MRARVHVDLIYPIGSIYMSVNSTNPSILFGGSWELFGPGRTLICMDSKQQEFNTVEKIGGSKFHKHTSGSLLACYLPKNDYNNALFRLKDIGETWSLSGYISETRIVNSGGGSSGKGVEIIGNTADAQALFPYITCYIWKRTT